MNKMHLKAGALFGMLGVALGAFGAHGLQKLTGDAAIVHGFQTGVQYQVYHALALLATGILSKEFPGRFLKFSGNCFIAGIILFSGSLYLISWLKIQASSLVKFAGPITPLGGLFFIAGWAMLGMALIRKN